MNWITNVVRPRIQRVFKKKDTPAPASESGKLNSAITTQGPYGRITLRLRETTPGKGSFGSSCS